MKNNQTDYLSEMMKNNGCKAKTLAVTSGKGGVGKTNITANLAICLAAAGRRVIIADADISLANLDLVLGINTRYNLSHVLSGVKKLDEILQPGPKGIEVLCGASGLQEMAELTEFQRQHLLRDLGYLQNNADVIMIDTAAGISKSVTGFCMASDQVLVVTTPEATAMADSYAMIKVLTGNGYRGRISLIVNMASSLAEGKKIYRQISGVAASFLNTHIYNAGVLLRDNHINSAVRNRQPVVLAYPKSKITASLAALAAKLDRCAEAPPNDEGFLQKVVNWFF